MIKKKCSVCKTIKPLELFDKDKKYSSGYRAHCTDCRKAIDQKSESKRREVNKHNLPKKVPKKCARCKKLKSADEFGSHLSKKDGMRGNCKPCEAEIAKAAKLRAIEKRKTGLVPIPAKKKCSDCKETMAAALFSANSANKDGLQGHCRNCAGKRSTQYSNERRATDPEYKLLDNIRRRIRSALERELAVKSNKSVELLGCSMSEFVLHLEQNFEPGMTWDNYGSSTDGSRKWNVDHCLPCAMFCMLVPAEQRRCFHYTNQQPMWANENLEKSDNVSVEDNTLSSLYAIFDPELTMW